MASKLNLAIVTLLALVFTGCAEKQFTQGEYDDPNEVRLLDDKFNESDASQLAEEMIKSMAAHPIFVDSKVPPVVQVEQVRNKTSEHIDTKSITDSIRTALIKTGKVRFANKEDREAVQGEVDYQSDSGRVRKDTQKKRGGAIGTDYVLTGDLVSNVQEVGSKKLIFYKMTLNLTNVTTGIIEWSEEKPIRKRFKKRAVGA
ncbi:MAG: penicillin-binding protein activator LpoB [Bdellovibrionales bacterium]|nr:penicillin-binding protein activator LpoB [Bdellovibrionales bacterium]